MWSFLQCDWCSSTPSLPCLVIACLKIVAVLWRCPQKTPYDGGVGGCGSRAPRFSCGLITHEWQPATETNTTTERERERESDLPARFLLAVLFLPTAPWRRRQCVLNVLAVLRFCSHMRNVQHHCEERGHVWRCPTASLCVSVCPCVSRLRPSCAENRVSQMIMLKIWHESGFNFFVCSFCWVFFGFFRRGSLKPLLELLSQQQVVQLRLDWQFTGSWTHGLIFRFRWLAFSEIQWNDVMYSETLFTGL